MCIEITIRLSWKENGRWDCKEITSGYIHNRPINEFDFDGTLSKLTEEWSKPNMTAELSEIVIR